MKKLLKLSLFSLFIVKSFIGFSQSEIIYPKNGSFEGKPSKSLFKLSGWFDCGKMNFPLETSPDIHSNKGYWEVSTQPQHCITFIGMVVRDNGTFESISQRLSESIDGGNCYKLSIHIARSPKYISLAHNTNEKENYIQPSVLKIYGGPSYCNQRELLAVSTPIENEEWIKYTFTLKPQKRVKYLTLQAYYKSGSMKHYNGHVLIDNLLPIVQCECNE